MPFSFLKALFAPKKREPEYRHWVWGTDGGKFKGLVERLQQETAAGKQVLVLAWFPKTLQELDYLLTNLNISFAKSMAEGGPMPVTLELADNYLKRLYRPGAYPTGAEVWLAEHYPLHGTEVALLEKLAQEAPETKPAIFASLDEKLFALFGANRIKEMMDKLGLGKDEMLEHQMIKNAVINAQKKVAEKVPSERKAQSSEEWFNLNYRN